MNTQEDSQKFTLSDSEQIVRTYECTRLQKLFSPATTGYLTITNKRLVYHSHGKSVTGSSTVLSEMPVEDVAGVSSTVGASVNWLFFLVFAAILYFGTAFLIGILPRFFTGWFVIVLFVLPYGIGLLFQKGIISESIRTQIMEQLDQTPAGKYLKQRDADFYMRIFYVMFIIGAVLAAWRIAFTTRLAFQAPIVSYALIAGVYFWLYLTYFGKQRAFSLVVASRTAQGSGIFIPGNSFSLVLGRDKTAMQSLSAGPAADAELIVKELGAVLTDIRLLGDMGVQKWVTQI